MESAKKFKAVLTDFKKAYVEEVDCPEIGEGQVLVRVEAAPINPSDQHYVVGSYGVKERLNDPPTGAGCEGAGTIVDAHESAKHLIGKKVSFSQDVHSKSFQGTWRQFIVLTQHEIIPFEGDIEAEKIASSFVNPLTASAFADIAKSNKYEAIIHSAASSSLGKMLVKHCKDEGVTLINIVRRKEQVKTLEALGAENILDSSTETFQEDLKAIAHKLNARGYFDPIGGDMTGQVLDCMPAKSTAYVYGGLSGKPVSYSPLGFIFGEKTISYFWLGPFLKTKSPAELNKIFGTVVKDLSTGGKVFGVDVVATYPLSDIEKALEEAVKNASEGKVMLKPQE